MNKKIKLTLIFILSGYSALFYQQSNAQTSCAGQSALEKGYQSYCSPGTCFKGSGTVGGMCEPAAVSQDKAASAEKEKQERSRLQCERMKNWAGDSRELIGTALRVSASSISLIRFRLGQTNCLAIVDTPKGPEKCAVLNVLQDKKSGEYYADMGGMGTQAVCGAWAF